MVSIVGGREREADRRLALAEVVDEVDELREAAAQARERGLY